MPQKKLEDLLKAYSEADTADQDLFAEQRSNLLLVAGEHYNKRHSRYWNRIRENRDLSDQQKLRLTKNHTQVISKRYKNSLYTYAPGVTVLPKNDTELQDIKSAELRQAVWQDAKVRYKLNKKIREWISDFVDLGEVAVKIQFDPDQGDLVGMEQALDAMGQPLVDEMGQPVASEKAVMTGAFTFERIFGFNLLREASAKSMDESPWLLIRKMVDIEVLKKAVGEDESKLKGLDEEQDHTYMVFDSSTMGYKSTKGQVMLREMYWKPSAEYPNGYYYIFTQGAILFEGELPFGIFPIVYQNFDEIPTTPRGRSIIKQLRPYQAEINRAASKIAEHQITLGDDKLLVQGGTTLAQGGLLPGVRGITYTGATPVILQGRDGSQYLAYMASQIEEMYRVAQIEEESLEKQQQLEPYTLLYQSLKQKKAMVLYASKMEEFLTDVCELYLRLHKQYATPETLILAVGRREYINIPEYKHSEDLGYEVRVEAQTDDIETKMGKQLTLSTILQYVGGNLNPEDIGKLIKSMPYANLDESFNDLTTDYENSKNDILQLDRGEMPQVNQYDNHVYIIKRLTNRMKQPDFKFLPPQVQQNYQIYLQQHEQVEAENQAQIAAAKSEYLPSGGYLVSLDFYVTDPTNPNKTRRARLPSQSVEWLIQKLEAQGMSLDKLETMNTSAQAEIAAKLLSGQQGMMAPTDQGGAMMQGGSSPEGSPNGNTNGSDAVLNAYERGASSSASQYGLR